MKILKRLLVNLSSASGGTIVDSQAIVYITDDDEPPSITIDDVTATDETPAAKFVHCYP